MKIALLVGMIVLFSAGKLFADENTEKALAIENKIIRTQIAFLQKELANAKEEIIKLKKFNSQESLSSKSSREPRRDRIDDLTNRIIWSITGKNPSPSKGKKD